MKLVIIRVGNQTLWQTLNPFGLWSSPESHVQEARNVFVEGHEVILLFVARGDIAIGAAKMTGVRQRILEDSIFPTSTDLGQLRTFLQFDPARILNLQSTSTITHLFSVSYIKYKVGSEHLIPDNFAREFISYFNNMQNFNQPAYNGNFTYIVPNNNVNYII
jgi:hypothetical protein